MKLSWTENFFWNKWGDSKNLSWADQRPYEKLECPGCLLKTREYFIMFSVSQQTDRGQEVNKIWSTTEATTNDKLIIKTIWIFGRLFLLHLPNFYSGYEKMNQPKIHEKSIIIVWYILFYEIFRDIDILIWV